MICLSEHQEKELQAVLQADPKNWNFQEDGEKVIALAVSLRVNFPEWSVDLQRYLERRLMGRFGAFKVHDIVDKLQFTFLVLKVMDFPLTC